MKVQVKTDYAALWKSAKGEWNNEPDEFEFVDDATGYHCLCLRNDLGAWCGYVGVPSEHQWHGIDYDDFAYSPLWRFALHWIKWIKERVFSGYFSTYGRSVASKIDVHGGITWSGDVWRLGRKGSWYFGFDCAHFMDLVPWMDAWRQSPDYPKELTRINNFLGASIPIDTYKNLEYVKRECIKLAGQLKKYEAA